MRTLLSVTAGLASVFHESAHAFPMIFTTGASYVISGALRLLDMLHLHADYADIVGE